MLIWDAISTTGPAAYKTMQRFLYTCQDEDTRLHIITVRHFIQLPTCFEKFVFEALQFLPDYNDKCEPEGKSSRAININSDQITGFHLWRTFAISVKLREHS